MRVPLISVGILSGKEIEFSFPIKFSLLRRNGKLRYAERLFTGMGRFIGKGKNIMNYLSLPNKVHLLSLN